MSSKAKKASKKQLQKNIVTATKGQGGNFGSTLAEKKAAAKKKKK